MGELELPDPECVDPEVLTALLIRHGWERKGGESGRYTRWTPPAAPGAPGTRYGAGTSLLVPATRDYGDYSELLGEALTALARSGAPSAREVLLALAVPGDEIRWRREVPQIAGAIPWAAADQLRCAARAMLTSAARAARGTAAYFGQRHGRYADTYLDQVLIGPANGGHLLTAYAPAPDGRAVTTTLLRALQSARDAIDYQRATGGMEAFDAAVGLGVCHELVESVVHLVRDTEGVEIALSWSPAAGLPAGIAARPEPVEFTPGDLPALQQASRRFIRAEPPVPVQVIGAVVRLRSTRPAGGGTVRLRVLAGADVRHIRVRLGEEAYRVAVHAHLAGLPLRVSGKLESRGGFQCLTRAADVASVPVEEEECEALLKSLH
ncbi:MAG: hypothetical protein JO362_13130 [Streptomycetaceae bacterium]|nr:hypothetical protein [Streptomycetaceae bacterium]